MENTTIAANDWNALLATAADKDVRYYLCGIYVDVKNQALVATDGHALLKLKLEVEIPATGRPDPHRHADEVVT